MPRIGLFDNAVTGYLGFCAVKFAAYSVAAHFISRAYHVTDRSALLIGGTRTLIGMVAGAAYFGLNRASGDALLRVGHSSYFIGLFPIRLAEWWLLLWLFYDRNFQHKAKDWRVVLLGTVWSYLCDIPATMGWLMTGGTIVC